MKQASSEGIMKAVISDTYFARKESLSRVGVKPLVDEYVKWGSLYCKPKQCFSNALATSQLEEIDLVIGYVYFPLYGVSVEHAWNRNESGEHFDMTAALFWDKNDTDKNEYFELATLSHKEADEFFDEFGGIHHIELLRSGRYNDCFQSRLVSFYAGNKKVS